MALAAPSGVGRLFIITFIGALALARTAKPALTGMCMKRLPNRKAMFQVTIAGNLFAGLALPALDLSASQFGGAWASASSMVFTDLMKACHV